MEDKNHQNVVARQQSQATKISGGPIITVEAMADQAWTEGRRQFVEPKRTERSRYVLGKDYERFLSGMSGEERQKYWRKIAGDTPHSAGGYFADYAEFYQILEERLSEALAREEGQ